MQELLELQTDHNVEDTIDMNTALELTTIRHSKLVWRLKPSMGQYDQYFQAPVSSIGRMMLFRTKMFSMCEVAQAS